MPSDKVRIGKIVGCHGIRGHLKVRPASDNADWADTVRQLWLRGGKKQAEEVAVQVAEAKPHGPQILLRLQEYPDRTAAEALIGAEVYALRSDLPVPEEGEYWADDLIGLTVVDAETGRARGMVQDLLSSAGSDFLEIKLEEASDTVVIPFIERFFPEVNLEARTISVDLLSDFLALATEPVTAERLEQ